MPVWAIEGANPAGDEVSVKIDCATEVDARKWAEKQKIFVSSIQTEKFLAVPKATRRSPETEKFLSIPKDAPPTSEEIKLLRSIDRHLHSISRWVALYGIVLAIAIVLCVLAFLWGLMVH